MYLKSLLMLILIIYYIVDSEEYFTFKVKQLENKIYKTTTKIIAKNEVDFQSTPEIIEKIKSSGILLPMKIDQDQIMIIKVETFSKNENGYIPFSGGVDSICTKQYINGQLNTKVTAATIDTSFKMNGYYNGTKMVLNEIKGNFIKPEIESELKQSISNMMKSIKFPENPLKIGDSFSQTIPFSVPVQGIINVNMIITIHYTLKSYVENIAYFNIEEEFELSSDADKSKIKMTGSGNGNMIYNSSLFQMTSMVTSSVMTMEISTENMNVISNSNTKTETLITVIDKN